MGLIDRIKNFIRPAPSGRVLKNRAGGHAWIKPFGHDHGAQVLAGRAVKTVARERGDWRIEPPQTFIVQGPAPVNCLGSGGTVYPGGGIMVMRLPDDLLEPWKEDGVSDAEVRKLYSPYHEPVVSREAISEGAA